MTCFTITGQYRVIICAIVKNEVAFFRGVRGINVLYVQKYKEMKSQIQRVELSRNEIFDPIIVISHRFLKKYK